MMKVLSLVRFVFAINYLDKIFEYNSNASYWIIKLLGNDINFSFFIRCLLAEKAVITVFIFFISIIFFFSFIIWIFEWDNPFSDFSDLWNCVWFVFITMTTVGYGDYLPITIYGRLLSFLICISGVMTVNLITVILADKLALKNNELKAL